MSIPANVSSTGVFRVTDWTPPPIEQLDFTTDCNLVHDFYGSWFSRLFDLGTNENPLAIYELPFSRNKTSFFVANSIDANTTEAYFRNALPPSLRDVPSFGQILDWEFALRTEFAQSLPTLAALPPPPEDHGIIDWFTNDALNAPYFTRVIRDPGLACRQEACSSFSWDRLIDINGPGVYVVYWAQTAVMLLASAVAVYELWLTRSRTPRRQHYGMLHSSLYRCLRRTTEAFIQGSSYFFAAAPLALFLDYMQKGPHYFPPNDQNTALVVACLSLFLLLWSWRMNRCFAAIDLVKGFSPVDSGLSLLPFACLIVCVPFLSFLLRIRSRSASDPFAIDAFDFGQFNVIICRGIEYHLSIERSSPNYTTTNNLFVITRLAITLMSCAAARVLWDDLSVRATVARILPWGRSKEFSAALQDAVLAANPKESGALNDKEVDDVTEALHRDPRTSAHIWNLGYGEMFGLAATSMFTLITYDPWRKAEVEWSQAGEQWNLGQILSLFTLAPVIVELVMSAQWSADGSGDFDVEGGINVLKWARNRKRRVASRRLVAGYNSQLGDHEMSGMT
ncbi:hypothetical protein B0T16DRAFT_423259 [Cercophora newfieldiana]|uniref:Uncharacterized protein n=1 Tax=Cercophora newfieldiana TaxID=92897 RepID=A0AA40CIA4_9PEZI|nr:hypothetical protein B0T16DRAFT_423259 [Cercophora newfieldiana]